MQMFELDTSGEVATDYNPLTKYRWADLSPFTQGYIEALFDAEAKRLNEERLAARMPLRRVRFSDLAPETLARIIADCEAFAPGRHPWLTPTEYGGAFYAARQVGFSEWSVDPADYGHRFPPLAIQLGDDGKVSFV